MILYGEELLAAPLSVLGLTVSRADRIGRDQAKLSANDLPLIPTLAASDS